jgi:cytochrome bd-type quinol oxidase subunit 1
MSAPPSLPPSRSGMHRFFGGSPLGVLFRLALLCVLVGVVLEVVGLNPWNIYDSLRMLYIKFWDLGFDAIHWLGRYFLLGAVLVIPIWLVMRLIRAPRGR